MNYELNIISRDQIPSNIYLCGKEDDEWRKINYFEFENGLKCVIGAGRYLSGKDAIESMKDEMDYIVESNSPEELQQYFYDNFDNFISYPDCVKIFKYYTENESLIKEAYYTYFDKEDDEEDDNKYIICDDTRDKIEEYINKYTDKYMKKAFEMVSKKVTKKIINKVQKIDDKLVLF